MVTDMVHTLRENCHSLAHSYSLCTYSTDTPNTAASQWSPLLHAVWSTHIRCCATCNYHIFQGKISKSQGLIRTSVALLFCMLLTRCAQVGVVMLKFGIDHPKAISATCMSDSQISVYSIGIRSGNEAVMSFSLLQDSAKAYSVLMSYLNLILFNHGDHTIPDHVTGSSTGVGVSRQLLSPLLADSLVEIYAKHRPEQLTNFLLHSWVKNYSRGTCFDLL